MHDADLIGKSVISAVSQAINPPVAELAIGADGGDLADPVALQQRVGALGKPGRPA
jgi:hypothetical protein